METEKLIQFKKQVQSEEQRSIKSTPLPSPTPTLWWIFHFLGFFTGGTTFILGTSCYFYPDWDNGALYAAVLYIIGSIGFLVVDLMEFVTFLDDFNLRINILLSATGSTLYIVGSIGWLPQIIDQSQFLGVWGFILGSAFIGGSQAWKVHRIGSNGSTQRFQINNILVSKDQFTAAGVEASAGLGAWSFFIGTTMYDMNYPDFDIVLWIWIAGSIFFTLGSLFLGYRHFVMKM